MIKTNNFKEKYESTMKDYKEFMAEYTNIMIGTGVDIQDSEIGGVVGKTTRILNEFVELTEASFDLINQQADQINDISDRIDLIIMKLSSIN